MRAAVATAFNDPEAAERLLRDVIKSAPASDAADEAYGMLSQIGRMNQSPLHVGDLLSCPRCRRWHPVVKWHCEGTAYTLRMLCFECRGKRYYAGRSIWTAVTKPRRRASNDFGRYEATLICDEE
jgi:hypothetical protein